MSASEDEPVQAVVYQPPTRKRPGRPCNDDRPMAPPLKVVKGTGSAVVLKQYVDARGRTGKAWVEVAPRDSRASITAQERATFLRCVAGIRTLGKESQLVVRNAQGKYETPEPVTLASTLLGISIVEGKRIHAEFQRDKVLPEGNTRGSYAHKLLLDELFGDAYVESWVRLTINKCKAEGTRPSYRTLCAGIQELAVQHGREESEALNIDVDEELMSIFQTAISYQKVRRWCVGHNWLFRKIEQRGKATLENSTRMNTLYATYAQILFAESDNPNVVFIYLDESYCNEKHNKAFAVLKPDDAESWPKYVKDGRRWCFCTAISAFGEIASLDIDFSSRWIFCPNKDQQKKADYHASFKSENFIPYFKDRLLPACTRVFPGKRLVFVMDNAGYHVSSAFEVPGADAATISVDRSSRKESLLRFIHHHRGEASANIGMLRAELEAMFVEISTALGCDIARLLRDQGHLLLLTPPRCSTWQPIELYWASVKNEVARLFKQNRSLQETRTQLEASLTKWGTQDHCSKLIAHTTKLVKSWWDSARRADTAAEANADAVVIDSNSDDSDDDDAQFSVHCQDEIFDD